MTPFFAVFTFAVAWFTMLFASMAVMRGRAVWMVLLFNTLLAGIITLGLHLLLQSGWIPLRNVYDNIE